MKHKKKPIKILFAAGALVVGAMLVGQFVMHRSKWGNVLSGGDGEEMVQNVLLTEGEEEDVVIQAVSGSAPELLVVRYIRADGSFEGFLEEELRRLEECYSERKITCYLFGDWMNESLARVEVDMEHLRYLYLEQDGVFYEISSEGQHSGQWDKSLEAVMTNLGMAGAGQMNGSELWGEKEGVTNTVVVYDFGTYQPQEVCWNAETETMEMGFHTPESEYNEAYWTYVNISRSEELPVFEEELEYFDFFREIHPNMDIYRSYKPAGDYLGSDEMGQFRWIHTSNGNICYFMWHGINYQMESYRSDEKTYDDRYMTKQLKDVYRPSDNYENYGKLDEYGYLQWADLMGRRYQFHQDIGVDDLLFFDVYPVHTEGVDWREEYDLMNIHIYREGDSEPFQELRVNSDHLGEIFSFEDYNADGYQDLRVFHGEGTGGQNSDHYVWSPSQEIFVEAPEPGVLGRYTIDLESRRLTYTYRGPNYNGDQVYELYQWVGETQFEPLRRWYPVDDERMCQRTITSYENGVPRVLSDASYTPAEIGYGVGTMAFHLFENDILWEGKARNPFTGETCTLLYQQNLMQNEEEVLEGQYKNLLFVLDSKTKLVRVLDWENNVEFDKAEILGETCVIYSYTDGSGQECLFEEIFDLGADNRRIREAVVNMDLSVRGNPLNWRSFDDGEYREHYYRVLTGQEELWISDTYSIPFLETAYSKKREAFSASNTAGKVRQRLANAIWRMILEQGDYHYLDYDGDGTPELAVDNLQDNGINMCIFKYIPEESRVQRLTGFLDDTWHLYDAGRLYREDVIQSGGEGCYWLELGEGSFSRDYPLSLLKVFSYEEEAKPHYYVKVRGDNYMTEVSEEVWQEILDLILEGIESGESRNKSQSFEELFGEFVTKL